MFFIYIFMYDSAYRYMWAHIRCTCMSSNCRNGNHQLSFNYFPKILLLYITIIYMLSLSIYIINYIYIILSNYFPKIKLSVMAMVMTIMPFGRPVYRFYIEITDASFNIYIKYLYNSEIPHISSLNCSQSL